MMSLAEARTRIATPHRGAVVRYTVTRFATVSDQVLVAITNFALTLTIGRAYSAEELASYGIGLSIALMAQGLQRHAIIIPLMLQPVDRAFRRRGDIAAQQLIVLASALIVGAMLLAGAAVGGLSHYGTLIVASSVVCLVVYLELEFARAVLVKLDRAGLLLASAGWYSIVCACLAAAALLGLMDYWSLLALLCAAMLCHAAALIAAIGGFALGRGLRLLLANVRNYGGWSAIATATYAGYNHAPLLILGALAAPIHAAAFVATRSLMQPLQILLRGLDIADKSSFSEGTGSLGRRSAFHQTMKLAGLYAGIACLFGIVAGSWADELVSLTYGNKFDGLGSVLIAWIPAYMLLSVTMPLESLVYARHEFRGYFLVRGIASILAVAIAVPLVVAFTEIGAISACSVGWLVAVTGTIWLLARGPRS